MYSEYSDFVNHWWIYIRAYLAKDDLTKKYYHCLPCTDAVQLCLVGSCRLVEVLRVRIQS